MPVKFKLLPGLTPVRFLLKTRVTHSLTPHTRSTHTTSEHHPQFLILHSSPSQPSKSLLVGERALAAAASWSLRSIPSVTIHRSVSPRVVTAAYLLGHGPVAASASRSPRSESLAFTAPGVADPSQAATPGSQSSWLSLYLGHSSLLLHTSLAVTDPLFSPGPLTVPARHCPHKHPLPRISLPQLLQAPVPSDSFPAPRHRRAKSNRLRGDARETSDRDCGPEVPPPARPLVNSTSAFLKTTTCHSRSASSRARRSE